jgi:hypothetical protein
MFPSSSTAESNPATATILMEAQIREPEAIVDINKHPQIRHGPG